MPKTNVNTIYQVNQHAEKDMKYKKTKEKSESVTVPRQFQTPEFQNGMFFLYYFTSSMSSLLGAFDSDRQQLFLSISQQLFLLIR